MAKMKVRFLKSAVKLEDCPAPTLPEIAFVGRSNAGKSSLINALFGCQIAKVSGKPGKTTLLNFFEVQDSFRFVDMPGYGYAARSASEVRSWRRMIENYFSCRSNLVGAVLIMDIRRKWQDDEEGLVSWLSQIEIPCAIVLSKADKLNRTQRERQLREMKKLLPKALLFSASIKDQRSLEPISDFLTNEWGQTKIEDV